MIAEILNAVDVIDAGIVVLLIAVGVYIVRLNRKIDRLRAALVEAGPMFETYENAIRAHRDSMSAFNEKLEAKRADPVVEFRPQPKAEPKPEPAPEPDPVEEDLSAMFYRKFGKEAV
ncbi:hypothetical protein [Psychromarinibacter sp. S121]|uniref:hypothetical protein n=1 Tax=Psychromarinibacter sp. S121 TaxID=3415127 RepID=UPI003C7C4AC0